MLIYSFPIHTYILIQNQIYCSLGGVSAALYAYISEFNIPRHRAVTINYSTMFVSVTAIYVPGKWNMSKLINHLDAFHVRFTIL